LSQARSLSQPHGTGVTLSWFRLCLQALLLAGEARYAEAVERTLHDALLGALQPDGHWRACFLELEGDAAPGICRYPEIKTDCW
jgi:uncharacterized protein